MDFPKDFLWGVATSSYQIEGAYKEDGRALSIWDVYSHTPDKIFDNTTGDIACDHYHKYKDDVKMMADLGIKAYRFSIAWPRLFIDDSFNLNPKGIEFYNNLIDELLKYNIKPFITLYHWDLPYFLYLKGGWMNNESSSWFALYAKAVADNFGDRVKNFITFNEPSVFLGCGCKSGVHAPGSKQCETDLLHMGHNVHLAHGKAVKVIRESVIDAKIAITFTTDPVIPFSKEDEQKAYNENFKCPSDNFVWSDSFWADPILLGKYPDELLNAYPDFRPSNEDMKLISQPLDYIGLNIYRGKFVGNWKRNVGAAHTEIGWDVTPQSLKWGPKHFYKRYNIPIYITENGLSCHDWISLDGKVHDYNRIDFLQRYLRMLKEAIEEGVDVKGYFQWSLMDNYEWAMGYQSRFGLVFVDFENQQRTPKDSAYWYKKVIESNGEIV